MKRSSAIASFVGYTFLVIGLGLYLFNELGPTHKQFNVISSKVEAKFTPPVDPFSAKELVKTHPRMQEICDAVGGCDKVDTECEVYDGSGNTDLRNSSWFKIGSDVYDTYLSGDGWFVMLSNNTFEVHGVKAFPYPIVKDRKLAMNDAIEVAITDWLADWKKYTDNHVIYPNSKPCDANCLK
jgi:hypothetical protein